LLQIGLAALAAQGRLNVVQIAEELITVLRKAA
jgi:hypothetical protein